MAWNACGTPVEEAALRRIFLDARTYNGWQDKPVPVDMLKQIS